MSTSFHEAIALLVSRPLLAIGSPEVPAFELCDLLSDACQAVPPADLLETPRLPLEVQRHELASLC